MKPIGYVVMMKLAGCDPEPAALTRGDDGTRRLLVRSCFTMFPSEADAEAAVRDMAGRTPKGTVTRATICAVFPAGMAAPHAKEKDA